MEAFTSILTEQRGRVGVVRLNRPQALNALNKILVGELMTALNKFNRDPEIGAMLLTGDERAFAAGADIKEMVEASAVDMLLRDQISLFDGIRQIAKPVIAAVSGWCLGGGNELAMSCDMIVASETAVFGMPEITLGIIPGAGGTQRLPRLIGPNRAKEFIFSGDFFKAEPCREMGLVNKVVPVADLLDEAKKLARRCIRNGAVALACAKACVNDGLNTDLYSGLSLERKCFSLLFSTADQKEGMAAFKEKRKAEFKGR